MTLGAAYFPAAACALGVLVPCGLSSVHLSYAATELAVWCACRVRGHAERAGWESCVLCRLSQPGALCLEFRPRTVQGNFAELSAVPNSAPLVSRGWCPGAWRWCSARQSCSVSAYILITSATRMCPPVNRSRCMPAESLCGAPSTANVNMELILRSAPAAFRFALTLWSTDVAQ